MAVAERSMQGREATGGRALAAAVAFLLVTFVVFAAALISAPTRGIRIFPIAAYIQEALNSGIWFVVGGLILGAALGILAALAVYRIWPNRSGRGEMIAAYVFLSPYLLITLVFTVGVILFALYIAFHQYNIFSAPVFVGIQNFTRAFATQDFRRSLVNVGWYAVVVTVVQTVLALLLAVLLNSRIRGKEGFRTIFYTPSVTSSVVISMIFWWLYLRGGIP